MTLWRRTRTRSARGRGRSLRRSVRSIVSSGSGAFGLFVCVAALVLVLIGPVFSPYTETEIVGIPYEAPSSDHWLGTDFLGRDAFSRFLHGGGILLLVGLLGTTLAYLVGGAVGMAAGVKRGFGDKAAVAVTDLFLSFPPIVFLLILVAAAGVGLSVAVVGIACVFVPRVVRIVRAITLEVAAQEFVEAAVARGENTTGIVVREILPNVWTPLLADFGIRLAGAILLFSSMCFLGVGQPPPVANWGAMISENRVGLLIQPWVVLVPAAAIAFLTVGVNLVSDAFARSLGRSIPVTDRS